MLLLLALLAPIRILGCPPADADRARALIALELEGVAVTAVELRCATDARLEVQVGDRRDARRFPKDVLAQPGGARLVAVAAADLAEDLAVAPTRPAPPTTPDPPTKPANAPPAVTLRLAPGLVLRSRFDDVQFGVSAALQAERAGLLIEGEAAAYLPFETAHALGETSAQRYETALGVGFLKRRDQLVSGGVIGWRAGYAILEGVAADDGATRTVEGVFGGPFLGNRVAWLVGALRYGFAFNLGWTVWPVTGRISGQAAEAEDGLWIALTARVEFGL